MSKAIDQELYGLIREVVTDAVNAQARGSWFVDVVFNESQDRTQWGQLTVVTDENRTETAGEVVLTIKPSWTPEVMKSKLRDVVWTLPILGHRDGYVLRNGELAQ